MYGQQRTGGCAERACWNVGGNAYICCYQITAPHRVRRGELAGDVVQRRGVQQRRLLLLLLRDDARPAAITQINTDITHTEWKADVNNDTVCLTFARSAQGTHLRSASRWCCQESCTHPSL